MEPLFFATPIEFRRWLAKNHTRSDEQWVGFYKKGTGLASITWPESVDEALCYGWIDGLRKTIDETAYKIRFTPRRPNSHWSAVNVKRVAALKKLGRMHERGLVAFDNRSKSKTARASYEQKSVRLSKELESTFRKKRKAWSDFQGRPPSYRKQCIWWIMSAKKEETRLRRLATLIESCAEGKLVPPLRWTKPKEK